MSKNICFFGQQHIGTAGYFGNKYHTIPITKFPNYLYLIGDVDSYTKYLRNTWHDEPRNKIEELIKKKINSFDKLITDISKNGIKEPIEYCIRFDGKKIITKGNHRAAIGYFLELDVPEIEISMKAKIMKNVNVPGKFGIKNGDIPYGSLYFKGFELIKGRRTDLLKRMGMIKKQDIKDKTILDIGCNIGSSSFLAIEKGAKTTIGIDSNPALLTAAIRNNTLFGYNSFFKRIDLSVKVPSNCKSNTAFIFSVDKHIKNNENIKQLILNNVSEIVYFETHENCSIPKIILDVFKKIDLIGMLGKRKLFRCEL